MLLTHVEEVSVSSVATSTVVALGTHRSHVQLNVLSHVDASVKHGFLDDLREA